MATTSCHPSNSAQPSLPRPLPPYLPRASSAPSRVRKIDLPSSQAGRFSLSLKGVRKELRQRGRRANELVRDVEDTMKAWLNGTTTAAAAAAAAEQIPRPVATHNHGTVAHPAAAQMDPFARYIIHCVTHWHSVVSFSNTYSLLNHTQIKASIAKTYQLPMEQ